MDALKVKVLVITFETGFLARAYVEDTDLKWPLLIDEKREIFRAYDMLSAGFLDIWGPRTWWAYLREIVKGHFPKKSAGDISQRGGDVLIDPTGFVRLHHIGQGPADRPPTRAILKIILSDTDIRYGHPD